MKVTGHPVFWIRPKNPSNFISPKLCVFTADISNAGWCGFPFLPAYGIIKIAKHSSGSVMDPEKDDRLVTETEVEEMRQFLEITFPELTDSPLVYTRRCLYTDTWDGHFWIDQHPEIKGLSVSSGGSGHALKMAPLLGEMTADMAEGLNHQFATRHKWRHLTADSPQAEEARHVVNRRI